MGNSERDGNTRPPTCLLRNLYAGQEATIRTGHGTTDWFQIGKGVCQGCMIHLDNILKSRDIILLTKVCLVKVVKVKVTQSCPTRSDPMDCSPWNSPGQNSGVGSLSLLQGIFPTLQRLNSGLPHCRQILYHLSHQRSPRTL